MEEDDFQARVGASLKRLSNGELRLAREALCPDDDPMHADLPLGKSSFEVEELRRHPKQPQRSDGLPWTGTAPYSGPYGAEWLREQELRRKMLERDPDYIFVKLVAAKSATDVEAFYDMEDLRDVLTRQRFFEQQERSQLAESSRITVTKLVSERDAAELQITSRTAAGGSFTVAESNAKESSEQAEEFAQAVSARWHKKNFEWIASVMRKIIFGKLVRPETPLSHVTTEDWSHEILAASIWTAGGAITVSEISDLRHAVDVILQSADALSRVAARAVKIDLLSDLSETQLEKQSVDVLLHALAVASVGWFEPVLGLDERTKWLNEPDAKKRLKTMFDHLQQQRLNPGQPTIDPEESAPDFGTTGQQVLTLLLTRNAIQATAVALSTPPTDGEITDVSDKLKLNDANWGINRPYQHGAASLVRFLPTREDFAFVDYGLPLRTRGKNEIAGRSLAVAALDVSQAERMAFDQQSKELALLRRQATDMRERIDGLLRGQVQIRPPESQYRHALEWLSRPENSGVVRIKDIVVGGIDEAYQKFVDYAWRQGGRGRDMWGGREPSREEPPDVEDLQHNKETRGEFAKLVAVEIALAKIRAPRQYYQSQFRRYTKLDEASSIDWFRRWLART